MVEYYDLIGLIGMSLNMGNYARLQLQREYAKHIVFSAGNFIGSLMMLYSLSYNWNTSAVIVNVIVSAFSLLGFFRCMKYKAKNDQAAAASTATA